MLFILICVLLFGSWILDLGIFEKSMEAKMYFLAILTPPQVNSKVLEWKYYMREHFGCVVALRSPAHITMIPPFWMDQELENKLIEDVQNFAAEKNPIKIELEDFDAFRPKVIFLHVKPNQPLAVLRSELENYLISKGSYPIKLEARPFHPHVTIANRDLMRKDFPEAFKHFAKMAYKQTYIATEIVLLKHVGGEWKTVQQFPFAIL
jgi:2'-5' RNA ligase